MCFPMLKQNSPYHLGIRSAISPLNGESLLNGYIYKTLPIGLINLSLTVGSKKNGEFGTGARK